jgi:hypothetical protein
MTSAPHPTTTPPPPPDLSSVRQDHGAAVSARARRWAPSPALGRPELLWVILAGVALAVITSWPLVLHLPSRIAPDLGDPVRTAWQIAWVGHAMLHDPLHLFDANAFYPHPLSLAFSDSLLGYGPAAFFGSGTVAALVRYNLLFLFAWSLCFVGAYLLARELGLGRIGGAVAGVALAYAPYRVTEAGHLHVISSGGIPLALFLLLRGYRRSSRGFVLAGWLVSAWQVSLGFTLGLQFSYLMAVLALLVLWHWWRGRTTQEGLRPLGQNAAQDPAARTGSVSILDRTPVPRHMLAVTCVGIAVFGVVAIYQARPYLKVSHLYPTAARTIKEVETYSSGPAALISASSENRVWGAATASIREHVHSKNEDVFFPGLAIFALAILGLCGVGGSPYTRRLRIGLLLGIVVCSVLAMGLGLTGAGYPYRLLYDYAPGWNGVRVPGRVFTLATLFYALLAAAGAQWLVLRMRAWEVGGSGPRDAAAIARANADGNANTNATTSSRQVASSRLLSLSALLGVVLTLGIVGEGAGHLGHPVVPQPTRAEIGLPGPLLDLPTDGAADRIWQYFSTNGFYKVPVGNSTFSIPAVNDLRGGMNGFPDRASVEKLRYYGIRTVVLHLQLPPLPGIVGYELAEPPNVAAAAAKPNAGLGITRREVGSVVIYEIGPGPAALHGTD